MKKIQIIIAITALITTSASNIDDFSSNDIRTIQKLKGH